MLKLVNGDATLESERLTLEPIFPHHARLLFPILADPQIYTFIPEDAPESISALERRYEVLTMRRSPSGDELWLNWALWHKQGATYIGILQATVYTDQSGSIAYLLASQFWGQGYASEACARLLRLLFEEYHLHMINAEVDTRNRASWRLLERLGFEQSAFRANADIFKGSTSDEYTYQLTVERWQGFNTRESVSK
jgi:[ribosomal protein S5]-alanine N-acetyltransferase